MPAPRILVVARHLDVLHARAASALRGLFEHGLQVAIAGGGDTADQERWISSGFDATLLPIGVPSRVRDVLAAPILTAACVEHPPTVIHVVDQSLLPLALAVRAVVPKLRISVEVSDCPRVLEAVDRLPDGTALAGTVSNAADRLARLPGLKRLSGASRKLIAGTIGTLRTARSGGAINAWLATTRQAEHELDDLLVGQMGRVHAHEYGFGVDNEQFFQAGDRDDAALAAREALGMGEHRAVACGVMEPGDPASLFDVIDASRLRVPGLHWLLFGRLPSGRLHVGRLQSLMDSGAVTVVQGYEDRATCYAASDLLVTVSPDFAQGWVMEFASTRGAAVAVSTPQTQLAIRDRESGALVEPGDTQAFVAAIRALVDSPSSRDIQGARARQLAMRLFDGTLMQRRLFRIWDAVLRDTLAADLPSPERAEAAQTPGRSVRDLAAGSSSDAND